MKLDEWPEEIEQGGWRWELHLNKNSYYAQPQYIRMEKLHVPPTMREVMEHLLKGGWVRHEYFKCGESDLELYYYKLSDAGYVEECCENKDPWRRLSEFTLHHCSKDYFLIQPGEWKE